MIHKEQKIIINDITFQVGPFMAVEGLRLQAYLVRTFGPALGEFLGGIDGTKVGSLGDIPLNGDGIARGLEKLLEQLDESSFIALIKRLLANVIANWNEDGKNRAISFGADFDTAMQLVFLGKLFSVYELLLFVLKVNYPDFFDKVVGRIGRKMRITPTSSVEETTLPSEFENLETSES